MEGRDIRELKGQQTALKQGIDNFLEINIPRFYVVSLFISLSLSLH